VDGGGKEGNVLRHVKREKNLSGRKNVQGGMSVSRTSPTQHRVAITFMVPSIRNRDILTFYDRYMARPLSVLYLITAVYPELAWL